METHVMFMKKILPCLSLLAATSGTALAYDTPIGDLKSSTTTDIYNNVTDVQGTWHTDNNTLKTNCSNISLPLYRFDLGNGNLLNADVSCINGSYSVHAYGTADGVPYDATYTVSTGNINDAVINFANPSGVRSPDIHINLGQKSQNTTFYNDGTMLVFGTTDGATRGCSESGFSIRRVIDARKGVSIEELRCFANKGAPDYDDLIFVNYHRW